ncbi:MAG: hypothetical protein ACREDO_05615 [Methyloceanibacter sp.]
MLVIHAKQQRMGEGTGQELRLGLIVDQEAVELGLAAIAIAKVIVQIGE